MKKSKTPNNILTLIAMVIGVIVFFLILSPVLELTILTQDGTNVTPVTDYMVGFDLLFRSPTPILALNQFSIFTWFIHLLAPIMAVIIFIPIQKLDKEELYFPIRNFIFAFILIVVTIFYFFDMIRVGDYFFRILIGEDRVVDMDYMLLSGVYFTMIFNLVFSGFLVFFGIKELKNSKLVDKKSKGRRVLRWKNG